MHAAQGVDTGNLLRGSHLVSLMGSSGSNLALLAGGELGKITVVITLPVAPKKSENIRTAASAIICGKRENPHLVIKDLGLASGGVGNEGLVKNIEDVLANLLQLALDLVAVLADSADVLIRALGLLLLLDRRDDSPAGPAGADNVLVSH